MVKSVEWGNQGWEKADSLLTARALVERLDPMADKLYVSVKCDAKDVFDSKLKSGLITAMTDNITDAINTKSGGKLTTKDKSDTGFVLTATLTSLKADDKAKPKKLEAKLGVSVMTIGSTAKAFNGNSSGAMDGVGSNVQSAAEGLVSDLLDDFMPKVIKTMLSL
jgi:hypothetical protein